ncbi:MAG: hypothetical protein IJH04_09525, partial [Eggerthellaceae bacterium]|nr:hypothetical protein [Eggerthellaceae bacterium]
TFTYTAMRRCRCHVGGREFKSRTSRHETPGHPAYRVAFFCDLPTSRGQCGDTYREPADDKFFNLKAYARTAQEGFRVDLEIRATAYTEPISRYCVILKNKDANVWCTSDSLHESGRGTIDSQDGSQLNAYLISVGRATTTGFPMRIAITNNETIGIEGVFHAVGENQYEKVPIVVVLPKEMFGFASDIEVPIDDVVGSDKTQKELCNYMANKMTEALVGSNVPKV